MTRTLEPKTTSPLAIRLPQPYSQTALSALAGANPALRFEQTAEGYLIVSPPTAASGNRGEIEFIVQLSAWNKRTRFGEVNGLTTGIHLPGGGDYVPDAFVVRQAAWETMSSGDRETDYIPVCPLAIFELLSPGNKTVTGFKADFLRKLDDYKNSAVPVVILLDPAPRTTTVRRPGRDDEVHLTPIVSFEELPELELDVAAIFEAIK